MSLVNSFSFSRLVKVFLPGVVIFGAFYLIVDALLLIGIQSYKPLQLATTGKTLFTLVLVIGAIILGLSANVLLFLRNRRTLHDPFQRDERNLSLIKAEARLKQYFLKSSPAGKIFGKDGVDAFDAEAFLLPVMDLEKNMLMRESYWSYLEFIRNITGGLYCMIPAVLLYSVAIFTRYGLSPVVFLIPIFVLLLLVGLIRVLKLGIQENYRSHRRKLLNLQIGALHFSKSA